MLKCSKPNLPMYHRFQIASGGALVAAIFTEMKYKNLGALTRFNIETVTEIEGINEIYLKTEATAGLVFATTGVAVLVGIIALIGRIANNRNAQSIRLFSSLVCISWINNRTWHHL